MDYNELPDESSSLFEIRKDLKSTMDSFDSTYVDVDDLIVGFESLKNLLRKTLQPHKESKDSHLKYYLFVYNPDFESDGFQLNVILKFDDSEDYVFQVELKIDNNQ